MVKQPHLMTQFIDIRDKIQDCRDDADVEEKEKVFIADVDIGV